MIKAASAGQDLYATVAARAFHTTYEDCLEHFIKDTPIKKDESGHWRYATQEEIELNDFDKLADGSTDTYDDGKNRRKQAKTILLGMMYGRGAGALAEQLNCDIDEAKDIMASVYKAFPTVKKFEQDKKAFANKYFYTSTLWGRRRHLDDLKLRPYEFDFSACKAPFNSRKDWQDKVREEWNQQFEKLEWNLDAKNELKERLEKEYGVKTIFNSVKRARADRQIINATIQGSAADMSKKALIAINNNQELKDLGFQMLVPIHDEILAQCPIANAKRCKELFTYEMENCAKDRVPLDIKVDPTCSFAWYGEEVDLDNIKETTKNKINLNEKVEIDLTDNAFDEIFADEENENEEEE